MAENMGVTPGSGATIRAKEHGSIKIQYVYVTTALATIVGVQQATIGTTAATLASLLSGAAIPTGATHALAQADSSNAGVIRWRDDAVNPTATVGLEITAANAVEWISLADIRLIGTAASQKVNISFRRYDQ